MTLGHSGLGETKVPPGVSDSSRTQTTNPRATTAIVLGLYIVVFPLEVIGERAVVGSSQPSGPGNKAVVRVVEWSGTTQQPTQSKPVRPASASEEHPVSRQVAVHLRHKDYRERGESE